MKTTIRVIASLIALGIGGVSVAMTFSFGMMFADGADRFIYAGLFALLDAAKFVLPTIAGYLAFLGLKNPSRLARFCYLFFALLSASSHVGLTLTVKDTESAGAKSAQVRLADATAARDRIQTQIDRLGAVPSSGSIAAELAQVERDPIFTQDNRSAGCTNDTADESRKLCDRWRILKGQKTDRQKLDGLVAGLDAAQQKVDGLNTGGTLKKANILASTLADKTGGDEGVILMIIAILLALGIEAGSSVLLALSMAVHHKPDAVPTVEASERAPEPEPDAPSDSINAALSGNNASEMLPEADPKAWVQSRMQPKRGARIPLAAALDLYRAEAEAEGMMPASQNAFSRALTANGYDRKRQNGAMVIVSAEVRSDEGKAKLALVR